jgi:hypothetical protein
MGRNKGAKRNGLAAFRPNIPLFQYSILPSGKSGQLKIRLLTPPFICYKRGKAGRDSCYLFFFGEDFNNGPGMRDLCKEPSGGA